MRIIYLHQYFKTNKDAGSTRSYEFGKYLSKIGNEVNVITGEGDENYSINDKFKIYSTKTKYSNNMSFYRRIYSFLHYIIKSILIGIKIKGVDVVFATSTPLTIGVPGCFLSIFKRCKFIFEVRDVWPDVPIELGFIRNRLLIKLLKRFELFIYKKADKIIVLSEGMYNNLIRKDVPKDKLEIITNLSNLELYKKKQDGKSELIHLDNRLKDKFVCIHPGAMGFVNGLDYILNAAKVMENLDKDIVFLLIGAGKEKQHLMDRVEKEGISNVIIKGSLPKANIAQIISSSDIGIMCVRDFEILKDNSANKFFDFLAAGLPILINYEGWQKDVLENNKCGLSCDAKNPAIMAENILKIKQDVDLYGSMRKKSREIAEEFYSIDKALIKLEKVFSSVQSNK